MAVAARPDPHYNTVKIMAWRRISAPAAGSITAVFSQLMALARYTSVGSHSAYGMGVIDVVADAP